MESGKPFPALERDIAFLHRQVAARNPQVIESTFNAENAFATFKMAGDIYYYLGHVGVQVRPERYAFKNPLITGQGLSKQRRNAVEGVADENDFQAVIKSTAECTDK